MARYIDADALVERLRLQYCKDCDNYNGIRCGSCDIDFVFDMVEDAPTADAVEVCRCKYCQHYEADIICEGVGYCNEHQRGMHENNFCSYGERRKDDE